MSTVERIEIGHEPAANSAPRFPRDVASARATAARGFLMQLVACEAQLAERNAAWLRTVGRSLAPSILSASCDRLARETDALHEELVVLAHRLVGRWNWLDRGRRLSVIALLSQPVCRSAEELVALHEAHVSGPTPWLELAAQRPIERMLADMVPLAIDLAGFMPGELEHAELVDAARLFGAREQRADDLAAILDQLIAADPERAALVRVAEEQAIAAFTKVLAECTQIGRELAGPHHRFSR